MKRDLESPCSLQWVLAETISALTHLNADRLEELERSARVLQGIPSVENVTEIVTNFQLLGLLLEETRQNLHVFRLVEARRYHQEDARGYAGIPSAS
jgi:hypothetical protein